MNWTLLILLIVIGIMNMPSSKKITKTEYFLCWAALIISLLVEVLR